MTEGPGAEVARRRFEVTGEAQSTLKARQFFISNNSIDGGTETSNFGQARYSVHQQQALSLYHSRVRKVLSFVTRNPNGTKNHSGAME